MDDEVEASAEQTADTCKSPYPWPKYDIDGGRQSPFESEDDYDYDSCCGPPLSSEAFITPGLAAMDTTSLSWDDGAMCKEGANLILPSAQGAKDLTGMHQSCDTLLVDRRLSGPGPLGGYKRRGRPASSASPHPRRQRTAVDVPFRFGS
mmetsp:Transcript_46884/g.149708  ORF Transcript_46884/g.149708 Transcript_46884/m.149708 type:complete len:149 (-) Transcript_46884:137-583(-)